MDFTLNDQLFTAPFTASARTVLLHERPQIVSAWPLSGPMTGSKISQEAQLQLTATNIYYRNSKVTCLFGDSPQDPAAKITRAFFGQVKNALCENNCSVCHPLRASSFSVV
jgi:hypothetical protein